jgi:putative ABC transport system permease protein
VQIRDIAFGSLRRRRGRAAFLAVSLALGIGSVVALVGLTGAMQAEIGDELDRFGANIVIAPRATMLDLAYGSLEVGGLTVDAKNLTETDARAVRTIPHKRNISAVAPKLIAPSEVDGERVLLIGVDFRQERGIKSWWELEGRVPQDTGEVLLGAEAARVLGRAPGARLAVHGRDLTVAGVLGATGALDDRAVFAELGLVQAALGRPGAVTLIEVSALCRGCPIEDIVAQIAAVLPHARVTPIRQAVAVREQAVAQMTRFAYLVAAIVLLAGGLVMTTTTLASVTERTQEIGILRAVGFRQTHVVRMILLEVLLVSAAGGALGWVAGSLGAHLFGRTIGQLAAPVPPSGELALFSLLAAVTLGLASGAYPAWRASRLDPTEAFRVLR